MWQRKIHSLPLFHLEHNSNVSVIILFGRDSSQELMLGKLSTIVEKLTSKKI